MDTYKEKFYNLIGPNEFEEFPSEEQMFMRQKVFRLDFPLCDEVSFNNYD